MLTIRPASTRGKTDFGWLDSSHSFSFGHYYDPRHLGFGPLRVINEDRVKPGAGFDTHGHRNMEILSYVISGALEHKDSTGTGSVIRRGDIQRMSAGSGILHSEYNHSQELPVHFLQIWIEPAQANIAPGYEQKTLHDSAQKNALALIASPGGGEHAVRIHQDARVYVSRLDAGRTVSHLLAPGRGAWLQVVSGTLTVNGSAVTAGDGASLSRETAVQLEATAESELLLFDLPSP